MSNWITGKELAAHWNIEDFDLFDCLKKGLQPYTRYGQKIFDTDTLERAPRMNFAACVDYFQALNERGKVLTNSYRDDQRKRTEHEIQQEARELYESQSWQLVNPPPQHMSFTLPNDQKKAAKAILKVMSLKFKKNEASIFAQQNGYRTLRQENNCKTSETNQVAVGAPAMTYQQPIEEKIQPSQEQRLVSGKFPQNQSELEDSHEKGVDVHDIVIEFENEDQVKIRIPEVPTKTETISNLGFQNAETEEARALKSLLQHGKFTRKGGSGTKLMRRIDNKLQTYFVRLGITLKSESKFILLKAAGTGHFMPGFKTRAPEFRGRKDFEKKLAWVKRECGRDKQIETINQAFAEGVISIKDAKCLYEDLKDDGSHALLDIAELTKEGGFNVKQFHTK